MMTIYALVDPHSHQVQYVGRTQRTVQQRFRQHLAIARRGSTRPVYVWLRSLLPKQALVIILQELNLGVERTHVAEAAETKWKKRFERSLLLCAIPRHTKTYRLLVNPPREG
jgi:GIY-YIG catalytic domain